MTKRKLNTKELGSCDWSKFRRSSQFGGSLREIPEPHIRFFGPENPTHPRREVKVLIMKYYGIGRHYWVSLDEEDNPIWNHKKKLWCSAWDDSKGRGKKFDQRFDSLHEAKQFIKEKIRKHWPKTSHKVRHDWDNLIEAERTVWFGKYKEGD